MLDPYQLGAIIVWGLSVPSVTKKSVPVGSSRDGLFCDLAVSYLHKERALIGVRTLSNQPGDTDAYLMSYRQRFYSSPVGLVPRGTGQCLSARRGR